MPHLVHIFPAFGGGGPEVRTSEIISYSADRFRHTVLSLSAEIRGRDRLPKGVTCESINYSSLWALSQAIRVHAADLVLTYGWGGTDAIAAARLAGIRRVVHTEDGFLDDEVVQQKWKRRLARRFAFKAAQLVVVPSLTLCDIARNTWRIGPDRLRYIPNGVNVDRFTVPTPEQKSAARAKLGLPNDGIVIGIVGALRPEKNQARLLDAFATLAPRFPRASLLIVGDGPQMALLRQAAIDKQIASRVVFTGSTQDTPTCYHAMDVVALSSDTEQMPLTILEGMASGLSVVSTDVGDVKQMVCEPNQSYVVPRDPPSRFVEALATLLSDSQQRSLLGESNRLRCVATFSWQQMYQSYFDLYQQFASVHPPTSRLLGFESRTPVGFETR